MNKTFVSIAVASALSFASLASASPTVSGNTISWPADGWYQVQDAKTYASVCEGGTSCDVPSSSYNVINLTTGERFENIVVGESSGGNGSVVSVDGLTLSWPDDGWYQVQNATTYESLCNGGTNCTVPVGTYIVINHTTGERFEGINVQASGETAATITAENMDSVIGTVFDIYTGQHEFVSQLYALPGFSGDREITKPQSTECLGGGTLEQDASWQEWMYFTDCVDGEKTLDGNIATYTDVSDWIVAEDFTSVNSRVAHSLSTDGVRLFPGAWGVEALTYYYSSEASNFALENADFGWVRAVNSGNAFYADTYGSFTVTSSKLLNGRALSVSAEDLHVGIAPQEVSSQYGDTVGGYSTTMSGVYQTEGTLSIRAEDGSEIMLNAATGDMATVAVELIYQGETVVSELRNWSDWQENIRNDVVGWVR